MTESSRSGGEEVRCRWCRRALPPRDGPGRPKVFCSQRCRQWDWVSRQRAAELQISDGELVVARRELDALHDELYVLACAVDDTERDLADVGTQPTVKELREILGWLLDAAKPLRERQVSAPSGRP
jgi:endogenous inhibitor of DNA gyrase (YacG/DUF329 family)